MAGKYDDMTVKELKALATRLGITIPKAAKKADIVKLIEDASDDVIEAEVIDPTEDTSLAIACRAGSITYNFDVLNRHVDEILADYEGWEPSADRVEDVEQCKQQRTYLNSLAKQIDERRKAVKVEYERPLKEFEGRANAIRDRIKATSDRLKSVIDEAEDFRKGAKEQELRNFYEEFAPLLVPVVPYEMLHDPKWLNKTVNIQKAKEELEARVSKVANDWETLASLGLSHIEQAEAVFFETLDVARAIEYANELTEKQRRVEEMKAEMAQPEPMSDYDNPPMDAYQPPMEEYPIEYPEPQPTRQMTAKERLMEAITEEQAERLLEIVTNVPTNEPLHPVVMICDNANTSQLIRAGKVLGFVGITGRFVSGTLEQAYQKEKERRGYGY